VSVELEWVILGFIGKSWRVLDHGHRTRAPRLGVSGRGMMTMVMMKMEHATTRGRRRHNNNNHLKDT
jgi:hypothetical protein